MIKIKSWKQRIQVWLTKWAGCSNPPCGGCGKPHTFKNMPAKSGLSHTEGVQYEVQVTVHHQLIYQHTKQPMNEYKYAKGNPCIYSLKQYKYTNSTIFFFVNVHFCCIQILILIIWQNILSILLYVVIGLQKMK